MHVKRKKSYKAHASFLLIAVIITCVFPVWIRRRSMSSPTPGRGGQPRLHLTHAASGAEVEVYLHGGQVLSWRPRGGAGGDVLYTAPHTVFDGVAPVRGGIPIAFPQFAAQGPLPQHGFARTCAWTPTVVRDGYAELTLRDSAATRAAWPHAFALSLRISFTGERLETALEVAHPAGGDGAPWPFEALQHTYLALGHGGAGVVGAGAVRVAGLEGVTYLSKPEGGAERVESSAGGFTLGGEEVDRIFVAPAGDGTVTVTGAGAAVAGAAGPPFRTIRVERRGEVRVGGRAPVAVPTDVVVWNPGSRKVMPELGGDGWSGFVCIEPGRVSPATAPPHDGATLAQGAAYTLTQTLTVSA